MAGSVLGAREGDELADPAELDGAADAAELDEPADAAELDEPADLAELGEGADAPEPAVVAEPELVCGARVGDPAAEAALDVAECVTPTAESA